MAYAAVTSLMQLLENTQSKDSGKHGILYEKEQIGSLQECLRKIVDNLCVDSCRNRSGSTDDIEARIKAAAYRAQDLVGCRVSEHFLWDEWFLGFMNRKSKFNRELRTVIEEFKGIERSLEAMDDSNEYRSNFARASSSAPTYDYPTISYGDVLTDLVNRLTSDEPGLQIIPIIGMVGIGKTTLARELYRDPYIRCRFDVLAWATASKDYQKRKVLLELLGCMKVLTTDERGKETHQLSADIYQCLMNKRYLIVIDDAWDTNVCDDILARSVSPDCRNRSRILLTTRLTQVADRANSDVSQRHCMRLLNDVESWHLMRSIVFHDQCFFLNLEEAGKENAKSCKGLPLSIVIISGLLSTVPPTKEEWDAVAVNVNSRLIADEQCYRLLNLIYDSLPHRLRACLLYVGAFPEDFEIPVPKLVKLWIAEGFIHPISGSRSSEEVAEEILTDLVSRQLLSICRRSISSGQIKSCTIHDLIREFCLGKAEEENFLHYITSNHGSSGSAIHDPRRLSCPSDFLGPSTLRQTFSSVQSLLFISNSYVAGASDALRHCRLLKVLNMERVYFKKFPSETLELVHLSYVYLLCEEAEIHIPDSIHRYLQNLQTLVISKRSNDNIKKGGSVVYLPKGVWSMPKLRHLKFGRCYMSCSFWNRSILGNLQTLSKLSSSCSNVNFFKRTPNLKKLGIHVGETEAHTFFSFGNVGNLPELEKLEVVVDGGSIVSIPTGFTLPQNLKKLTLNGTKLPWKDISIVRSLTKLEELTLATDAFRGTEWETETEDIFHQLKYLTLDELNLEYWIAQKESFPLLEHLAIWECGKLKNISNEIREIDPLQMIELDDASPHAVTWAKEAERYQHEMSEGFQVLFYNIWNNEYEKRKKDKEAYERRKQQEEERQRRERSWGGIPPSNAGRDFHRTPMPSSDAFPRHNPTASFDHFPRHTPMSSFDPFPMGNR